MNRYRIGMALAAGLLPVLVAAPVPGVAPAARPPEPEPGYHHLGATTDGSWSGVLGRLTVRHPAVRPGSYDFVAVRFMAKAQTPSGVKWLEAGWAQTGWSGGGRQRVYTFDTNTGKWTFYDQYPIKDGDQIWIELTAGGTAADPVWSAWLWWGDAWHLLTTQHLPIGERATIEQYAEVYVDPKRGGDLDLPPVKVDNVQLAPDPGAAMEYWTPDNAPSVAGSGGDGYCLDWQITYDTWQAGTC